MEVGTELWKQFDGRCVASVIGFVQMCDALVVRMVDCKLKGREFFFFIEILSLFAPPLANSNLMSESYTPHKLSVGRPCSKR